MKHPFLSLLLALILVVVAGCDSEPADGIKMPFSASTCKGENYQEVVAELEEAGFTNVQVEILDDLIIGFLTEDGEVEQVTINGDTTFSTDTRCPKDAEIIVAYHTFPQTEEDSGAFSSEDKDGVEVLKIKPPYDNDSAGGLNYLDVVEAFKSAGFTNVITEKRYESAFSGREKNTVANIYIDNSGTFSSDRVYSFDAEIRIDYYVISDSKSDAELTKYYAQTAFEKYGKRLYPYGFKCHWILDLRNAEQSDDGSWFLKVGVTIENQYGNKTDTVAEGIISGTDDSPIVTYFYVSE